MARSDTAQLNIRSRFARERAAELARRTGMTTTQVVEEALRAFSPPGAPLPETPDLVRKGPLLVLVGGDSVTPAEVQAAIDQDRESRGQIEA